MAHGSIYANNIGVAKNMTITKNKSTKRFNFGISRNPTSKKAGRNTVTISTQPESEFYSHGTTSVTMTVKEAKALQLFLNSYLLDNPAMDVAIA